VYLIDGYNLLHAFARGRADAAARERLLERIRAWCLRGGYAARAVFDPTGGMKRREQRGPLEVRVVAQGRTADEELMAEIARCGDRTAFRVVSNDREIAEAARRGKLEVIGCEDFLRRLEEPPSGGEGKPEGDLPPGEVDSWMKEFGL
jgi:predicted RNA-binding protein with PIN domain